MDTKEQVAAIVDPNTQHVFELGNVIRYVYSTELEIIIPIIASNQIITELPEINSNLVAGNEVAGLELITRINQDANHNKAYPYEVCAKLTPTQSKSFHFLFNPTSYCNYEYRVIMPEIIGPAWIDVTSIEHWFVTDGVGWFQDWELPGLIRASTFIPEEQNIPYWLGLRPTKFRITTGEQHGDGAKEMMLFFKSYEPFIVTAQEYNTTVIYDVPLPTEAPEYDSDFGWIEHSGAVIEKIEILL